MTTGRCRENSAMILMALGYTRLQAEILFRQGKTANAGHVLISPLLRFIKFYIFRLGVFDGLPGLVHVGVGCFNSFMKYAKLRGMSIRSRC
jgi:hypothetical protein